MKCLTITDFMLMHGEGDHKNTHIHTQTHQKKKNCTNNNISQKILVNDLLHPLHLLSNPRSFN